MKHNLRSVIMLSSLIAVLVFLIGFRLGKHVESLNKAYVAPTQIPTASPIPSPTPKVVLSPTEALSPTPTPRAKLPSVTIVPTSAIILSPTSTSPQIPQ